MSAPLYGLVQKDTPAKVRAFLADSVQTVEGKLYVLGAGWNRLAAGGFPARHDRVGVGVLLTIEEGGTTEHNLELSLLDEHEHPVALFTDPSGTEQFAVNATFQTQAPAGWPEPASRCESLSDQNG